MFIRSNFAERRKYNRFKVAEGAFAKFHKPRLFKLIKPRIVKSAPIIDISLEGLAFQYNERDCTESMHRIRVVKLGYCHMMQNIYKDLEDSNEE